MAPAQSTMLALLAYVFLQNSRPDKAAVVLAALDAMEPGRPRVLRGLMIAQMRSGKVARALETLDRLAMAGGVDAAFHLLRTQALVLSDRREEAAVAMRTYLHLREAATARPPA